MGKEKHLGFLIIILILLVGLTQLPYIIAFVSSPPDYKFGGFLINPLDGNSYLAKMYQGYQGDWSFTLPFSVEKSSGTFLFFFYILLGHLARVSGLSIILVFHLTRVFGSICLVLALSSLFERLFIDKWSYTVAMILACFGSGMGWVVMTTGYITSDFWVAEAYPFLSVLVNPHFSIGMTLMVWLLSGLLDQNSFISGKKAILIILAAFILGLLAPFGVVILGVLIAGLICFNLINVIREKQFLLTDETKNLIYKLICISIGGIPILVYELFVVNKDPILKAWNAQNITGSPPIWDFVLSFSPMLVMALFGLINIWRQKVQPWYSIVLWAVIGITFVYIPWPLQRRFLFALYIPLVGLAVFTFQNIKNSSKIKGFPYTLLLSLLLIFTFTTNVLLEMTTLYGINTKDPLLFLTQSEDEALQWLEENTPAEALVLASPQMGLFIPAHTGRRVLYGHPFETIEAETRQSQVESFFSNINSPNLSEYQLGFLAEYQVDYVFWGPREHLLSESQIADIDYHDLESVFQNDEVIIYQVIQ